VTDGKVSVFAFGAVAQDHTTYRCNVKDGVNLQDDGQLRRDNVAKSKERLYDSILLDTLTGAVTRGDGQREIWRIIQEGSGANDYVLTPPKKGESTVKQFVVNAATDFIRLRAWYDRPRVTFLAFELDTLVSGTCEVVR